MGSSSHGVYPRAGRGNRCRCARPREGGGLSPVGGGTTPPDGGGLVYPRVGVHQASRPGHQEGPTEVNKGTVLVGWQGQVARGRPVVSPAWVPGGTGRPRRSGSIPAWAARTWPRRPTEPDRVNCGAGEPRGEVDAFNEVYPRVGMGHLRHLVSAVTATKMPESIPAWAGELSKVSRSIPAWAGEPFSSGSAEPPRRVYPRVGGGTGDKRHRTTVTYGLSPRGRGNPGHVGQVAKADGSIPAWAGEPSPYSLRAAGLSPRGRGNPRSRPGRSGQDRGLSPRGRGNP